MILSNSEILQKNKLIHRLSNQNLMQELVFMKIFRTIFCVAFVLGLMSAMAWGQVTTASWSFDAVIATNTGTSPTVTGGSATADAGILTSGSSFTALHASASTVWSEPTGSPGKALSSTYWATGDYFQFLFSTTGYTSINLSWMQYGSGTGPKNFKVQYSTDGSTFTDATGTNSTYALAAASTWYTMTLDLSSVTALNNQSTVYIRLVDNSTTSIANGTVGTSGTDRVDNFKAIGTAPIHDGDGTAILLNAIGSGNLNTTTIFPSNTASQSVEVTVTGTSVGTLAHVSVTIPSSWTWTGIASDVAPSIDDGAGLTNAVISGDGSSGSPWVITYDGAITNTSLAKITISNLTSANPTTITDNGNYSFIVKTATSSGTLTAMGASPTAYLVIPLSHVKNQSSGVPVLNGMTVATKGVATVANGIFSTSQLQGYMQDGNYGVNVFLASTPPTFTEGTSYIVKGLVQQYNGNTEVTPTSSADIIDNGVSTMPAYVVVTAAELIADPETYEGRYIAVQHLSKTSGTWPTTAVVTTLVMSDGAALNVLLAATTDMHSNTEPIWPMDIKGIFSQTASTPAYVLSPRYYTQDIALDGALPVEMTSFTAAMQSANCAILKWSTATEVNNNGFEIERRAANSEQLTANSKQSIVNSWQKIGFVAGAGTSNSPKEYSFTDNSLSPGVQIYRIKQIDNDGTFKYSASAQVDAGVAAKSFQLLSNYPNPFNPSTEIRFSVPEDGFASLKVYNILGQEVATLFNGIAQSGHYIAATFNAGSFASGVYFSRLEYNGKSLVQRMLLTK
jgi:hypothetical protein